MHRDRELLFSIQSRTRVLEAAKVYIFGYAPRNDNELDHGRLSIGQRTDIIVSSSISGIRTICDASIKLSQTFCGEVIAKWSEVLGGLAPRLDATRLLG